MIRRRRLAALTILGLTACAGSPRGPFDPGPTILAAEAALGRGDLVRAEELLAAARLRVREHGTVRLWSAKTAAMRWRVEDALRDLAVARRADERGDWSEEDVRGEMGDLLFRVGRYGESAGHLRAGAVGPTGPTRAAMAELARRLPYVRINPPELEFAELPMQSMDLPLVRCAVGQLERIFVLDTGASFTTLSRSLAAELGVDPVLPSGTGTDGTGQPFPTWVGRLTAFSLGDVDLGPQPVLVVADRRLDVRSSAGASSIAARGLVGLDVITRFRTTLDPARGSVAFQRARGLAPSRSVDCLWTEDRLIVPVSIEDRTLWFALDTGASTSSLTPGGLALLAGGERRAQEGVRQVRSPGGGVIAVRVVRGLVLQVSEVRFRGVDLPVVARGPAPTFPLHGVLGADLLLRCRTTLDRGRARIEPL